MQHTSLVGLRVRRVQFLSSSYPPLGSTGVVESKKDDGWVVSFDGYGCWWMQPREVTIVVTQVMRWDWELNRWVSLEGACV